MKLKKEYIILALVIIALSAYLVMRTSDRTQYQLPDIPPVDGKEISKLQLTKGKTVISLNKKDEKWYIAPQDYPADADRVKDMLEAVETLTLTVLVSESKNYTLYDLGEDKKINLKAWTAGPLVRDVDLGKTASSFRHTFVKRAGDDRVFHARGHFRNHFDYDVDGLRDKQVLTLSAADIQQIQITKAQQSLTLNRTQAPVVVEDAQAEKPKEAAQEAVKPSWQAADGRPVDEAVVKEIIDTVSDLRCEKFIDGSAKDDFTSPLFTLRLKGPQEHSLSIFAKSAEKDTDYPAVSSGSQYPFELAGSQVDRIMKDPIKPPPKAPEAEETNSN